MSTDGIPSGALWAFIIVLLYSIICLVLCILLVCLLWSYGEKWSYVTLITAFTSLSTLASIVEQIHYATSFRDVKQAEYENALRSLKTTTYGYNDSPQKVDMVLFWIQFYCYDAISLNILFWSVTLFCGSWEIRAAWLGSSRDKAGPCAKIFSVLFPGIVIGIANSSSVFEVPGLFLFFRDITVLVSLFGGSVLLVLILYKYVSTRRLLARNIKRSGWWAPMVSKDRNNRDIGMDGTTTSSGLSSIQIRIYDHALVTRFTLGFLVLAAFNAVIIILPVFDLKSNRRLAQMAGPDLSLSKTISEILLFLPGVTTSLAIFLVFGTTKSWRQYHDMILNCTGTKERVKKGKIVKGVGNSKTNDSNSRKQEGLTSEGFRMNNLESVDQTGVVKPPASLYRQDSLYIDRHEGSMNMLHNTRKSQQRDINFSISLTDRIMNKHRSSVSGDSDLPILPLDAQIAFEDPVVQRGHISLQDHQQRNLEKEENILRRQEQWRYEYANTQRPVMPVALSRNAPHNFLDDSSD